MMSLDDAGDVLELVRGLAPGTTCRMAFPYSEELVQKLYGAGYLPALEHNAWNEIEIIVSTSKCIDVSPQSE